MARDAIALYIDQVEAYKLISRDVARDVARALDFDKLADDPDGHIEELIALLIDHLEDRVFVPITEITINFMSSIGFDDSPDEGLLAALIANALLDAEFRMTAEFEAWSSDLGRQIDDITGAGLAPDIERQAVGLLELTAAAALASMLATASIAVTNDVATTVSQEFLVENAGAGQLLRWATVQDDRICGGIFDVACSPRHGVVGTLEEWEEVGLPNAPNLNCVRWNGMPVCRCVVYPADRDIGDEPIRVARRV